MRLSRKIVLLCVLGAGVAAAPAALAVLPMPTYPLCGSRADHDAEDCPNDFGDPWQFISYIKTNYSAGVRPEELEVGSGIHLDQAFAVETGDFNITIASLDSGIRWSEGNTLRKWRLNYAELPLPQRADGTTSSKYDLTGDGIVNIDDYAQDPRVKVTAGDDEADTVLDPSDLIFTFSDGIDQDGNGYVDDICGWDFLWNDNDPFDNVENQGYSHGTIQIRRSGAEGGDGGSIGSCPNCSLWMLRTGDAFIGESSAIAQAVVYAVDNGAKVIQFEQGGLNASGFARDAIEYAWKKGVTFIASAADEASIHANEPSAADHTIVVHPMVFSGADESTSESFQVFDNCADFGGRPTFSISYDGCSSEATAVGAGLAGLVQSAGLHAGLTLTSNEIYQIFIQTVDDVWVTEAYEANKKWYPSNEGWDRYFGYGRVNIRRALDQILDRTVPPEADLTAPSWFQVLDPVQTPIFTVKGYVAANRSSSYSYVVEYGAGLEPTAYTTIATGTNQTKAINGVLAQWDLTKIPKSVIDAAAPIPEFELGDDNVARMNKINSPTLTLRVRVMDASGLAGEMRKTIYLRADPDMLAGFPLYLGASLESSPKIIDLDGDGKEDIIQATSDGVVHALRYNGTELTGWPVKTGLLRALDPSLKGNHAGAPAYKSGAMSASRNQSTDSTVAVGDLDKDGKYEVVIATYDGQVFAWHANGQVVTGFPVSIDYAKATDALSGNTNIVEDGFFGSPALGDLNGDGYLDIIVPGMDQYVYAWDRNGKAVAGWPVLCKYPFRSAFPVAGARIMTTPALGDVDNDGMLDVVIGTAEVVNYVYSPTYVLHGDGNNHRGGAFHKGWPILTLGLYANLLPDVGTGTTSSPALADIDGDGMLEIATHTIASYTAGTNGSIFRADGKVFSSLDWKGHDLGPGSNVSEPIVMPLLTSGAFGDIDQDGSLDYTIGLGGGSYLGNMLSSNSIVNYTFSTGAWNATTGQFLDGFPQAISDMQFFMHQIVVDVDGDGFPETISANGAFTVHAFNFEGIQPTGWPKFTGQWGIATPAVGDMNGDGLLELVEGTRTGYLYAWKTRGKTLKNGGVVEWGSYHHDAHNTGNYEVDLAQFAPRVAAARRAPSSATGPATRGAASSPIRKSGRH